MLEAAPIPKTQIQSLQTLKQETTPKEYSASLRGLGPLFFWPKGGFHVVTNYKLAQKVMKDSEFSADRSSFFISRMPNLDLSLISDFFSVVKKMMVMSDGGEHKRRRNIAAQAIDGKLIEVYRQIIRSRVAEILDRSGQKGRMDFVTDMAKPLPFIVLADIFGIPENQRGKFYECAVNMTQFFGGATTYENPDGVRVNHSASELRKALRMRIEEVRKASEESYLSILLSQQEKYDLTDDELISQTIMMIVAGQVTTTDQMNNNLFLMLNEPTIDKSNIEEHLPAYIEEATRLDPAVTYLFRVVNKPVELGGVQLKEKDVVFVSNHGVNRDPDLFDSPNEFQIRKNSNKHMGYGHGPHYCVGARVAQMMMFESFGQIFKRFPGVKLDESQPAIRDHYSLSFSGFKTLPLVL